MLSVHVIYVVYSEGMSAAASVCLQFMPVLSVGFVLLYMLMVIILESFI